MKKNFIKRISYVVLFCFMFLLIGDAYPLQAQAEQDCIALIEKGEAEYRDGFYREALDSFSRALVMVQKTNNRERLLLDIALVNFALGSNDKCSEALSMFLDDNPEKEIDRVVFPKGFLRVYDQTQSLVMEKKAEQKRLEDQKRAEESRKVEEQFRLAQEKIAAEKKETAPVLTNESIKTEVAEPIVQEKEKPVQQIEKKKKKFPWLLAILGVGVVVVLIVLLTKKKEQTLTVNLDAGITGSPSVTAKYKKGTVVNYSYAAQSGYGSLQVRIDNVVVSNSGTVTMNSDHTLNVSAAQQYTLTVHLGTGTTGNPAATASYDKDQVVNYSYSAKTGYGSLQVKLDNGVVAASGIVTMNGNHTLSVSAIRKTYYVLTVTRSEGIKGSPVAGNLTVEAGQSIAYSFSLHPSYTGLKVALNGKTVVNSGTITVNKKSTLSAKANWTGVYDIRGSWDNGSTIFVGSLKEGILKGHNYGTEYSVSGKKVYYMICRGEWCGGQFSYNGTFVSPTKITGTMEAWEDGYFQYSKSFTIERTDK